jgi:hypothetical protein
MRHLAVLIFFLATLTKANAQKSVRDSSISFTMLGASFQYQVPGGDMARRFGNNFNVGGLLNYKFANNWLIGLDGGFLFAETVREDDILDGLETKDGYIISESGEYATIYLFQRGYMFSLKAGKVLNLFGPNKNSGLLLSAGAGFLEHKIKIEVDKEDVPALTKEYRKGYDRLSNGLALTEGIMYLHCGNRRLINFMIGFELTQAFTQNRRDYNFDQMKKDDSSRLDLLYGLKFCWFFPIYRHAATNYYYY